MTTLFTFAASLILALVRITGYTAVFILQVIWFLCHKRSDKIGGAFGWFAEGIIDSMVGVFTKSLTATLCAHASRL